MGIILNFAMMFIEGLFRIVVFTGFYWVLLLTLPSEIYGWITGNRVPDWMVDIGLYPGLVLALFTTVQNIIRMVTKDRSFSLLRAIMNRRSRNIGIESRLVGDTVASVKASELCGVVFGKLKSNFIIKPESADGHILIIGGAGSGKTSGIAIPTIMSWKNRVFAIDIKGELYEKTRAARSEANIKVFNPTDRNAYRYDPYYMLRNTDDLSGEARSLALSICPISADIKDPFWIRSAQYMLTGFIVYLFNRGLNFAESMRVIKSDNVKNLIAEIMESDDTRAITEVSQFDGMNDKTLSGVFSELSNHITVFATSDDLQNALNGEGCCITPADLENGYDIFCCIPEHKLDQWKDLFGMMCNQFLKAFERRPDSNTTPILFLIDEFPRLGKIETVSTGLATLRSKKIHIALCVQSKSQLNAIYGNDTSEVIADNCSYKAILRASEPNTQEWCSKLVGTFDKLKKSSSYNADIIGIGKGQGSSTTTEEKRIIKPEEFAYLDDVVCMFPDGYRRVEKIRYWEEEAFSMVRSYDEFDLI